MCKPINEGCLKIYILLVSWNVRKNYDYSEGAKGL